jgi:Mrp family chromosome partitioning ATPase
LRNELSSTLPQGRRVIVVTAASPATDSSVVASNLAASLAQGGSRVTLVGAEPDFPAVAALADGGPGLAEVMAGSAKLDQVAHPVPDVPHLKVVGPGRDAGALSAQVQGNAPAKLLENMLRSTDFLVVHAPSTSTSLDAQSLARMAHAAVVVVEAGRTEIDDLVDAVAQLQQVRLREVFCLVMAPQRRPSAARIGSADAEPVPLGEPPAEPSAADEPSTSSGGSGTAAAGRR